MDDSVPRGILNATSYSLGDNSNAVDDGAFDESEICDDEVLQQLLDKPFSQLVDGMQLRRNDRYAGFDNNAGSSWIYPTNYPVRKYQFSISQVSLFQNTLVVLPTGLGKTFIAAVVMYNFYRWYPTGKVIFMAPTRPLVAQQIEACYKIMGIPKEDTIEMTGKQQKKNRSSLWREKRVFFATPQVVQADINNPEIEFPIKNIKLIVIDEAHKAKGHYAFVEVVKGVADSNKSFRVLALSATPGRTLQDVAEIVRNLLISHIEVRWENSIDVSPYTFRKNINTVVIPLGPKLTKIRDEYIRLVDPYVRRLLDANVLYGHAGSLNSGWLMHQRKRFQADCLINRPANYSAINSDFSACMSLYHGMELLIRHGVRAFLNYFDHDDSNKEKYFVLLDPHLRVFLSELREEYDSNPLVVGNSNVCAMPNGVVPAIAAGKNFDYGHPKFDILRRRLNDHFQNHPESKVIVFSEFRDSVAMIHQLLLQSRPIVRPKCIVGQGGTGSSAPLRAVTQKEQIAAMKDFRTGKFNTLIATCVVEEGLDVGEVDLIVCFDISKNHTRFVQRIGRTGRKRVGRALILVTEGKEHETLKEVLATKDKTNQQLAKSKDILNALYRQSPRMIPPEFDPKCVETFIKIPDESADVADQSKKRKRRTEQENDASEVEAKTPKRTRSKRKTDEAVRGTQDVRNYFRKIDTDLDASEKLVFCTPPKDTSTDSGNNTNTSFKVPVDASIRLGKSEEEEAIENILKPLLRHKARLGRERYLNDRKLLKLFPQKEACSSVLCPNPLKKLFYEANIDKVRTMVEKSNNLGSILDDIDDVVILNDEGDCLNSELRTVESIFGGSDALKDRLDYMHDYQVVTQRMRTQRETESKISGEIGSTQISTFNELFEKFSTYGIHTKCSPKKDNNLPDKSASPAELSTSNLFDSQFYLPSVIEQNDSSYVPPEPPPVKHKTPIRRVKSKSRLDELIKSEKRTPANIANSPLLRAFNRSIQKAKNSDFASPISSRQQSKDLSFQMVLEYFELRSLEQVFEESQVEAQPPRFGDRLEQVENNDELETGHIAELSKSLFDCNELDLEAQEAAFLANDFSREEPAKLEATLPKEDLDTSPRPLTPQDIPIDDFLRAFSDDESPVKPTCSAKSQTQSRKALNLDIEQFLEDLNENAMDNPTNGKASSEEIIPNSQDAGVIESAASMVCDKNLDIGNLEDLFADSEDDLFVGDSVHSNQNECNGDESDKTVDYDMNEIRPRQEKTPETISRQKKVSDEVHSTTPVSSKNNSLSKCEERSPSMLRKKINFSRLRLTKPEEGSKLEVNSAPVVRENSTLRTTQPNFFASCQPAQVGGVRQELVSRFSFQRKLVSPNCSIPADSSAIFPRAKRKAIVSSDSDENEVFQTARSRVQSSSEMEKSNRFPAHRKKQRRRNNGNPYLLSQAEVSDEEDDSHEEDDEEEDDSIINNDPVENDAVDMRAKYLQSVRSPLSRGAFKIPVAPSRQMNLSDIYSQLPNEHEQDQSRFHEDSFVVHESDEHEVESELDELERAEAILRERRRAKRRGKSSSLPVGKRRRKIIQSDQSSDEGHEIKAFRRQMLSGSDESH
ncbi:uncharacterized protein LOC129717796 [Wyeomyia smithii]|uniref:uncharacterized protein LOC129717796 n=1 Tax=Wyeomyia smithii TaxID=174621 RepID=UPI002467E5AC|nr:uncharacterized protein LOC129717796 [Wyeomyia smithii]